MYAERCTESVYAQAFMTELLRAVAMLSFIVIGVATSEFVP